MKPNSAAKIQAYMRVSASQGRYVEQIGPFLATFSSHTDLIYLNYAIPENAATPSQQEVSALVQAYEQRGRKARLEYLPELAPAVEPALVEGGFASEGRFPLMVYNAKADVASVTGFEIVVATTDEELQAALTAQYDAYEQLASLTKEDLERLRSSVALGGIVVLARDTTSGEPAGAGICTPPSEGITEVVGIGVRPIFRRRGIAAVVTSRLAHEAYDSGISTIFLAAAPGEAERVYGRVGFKTITEILHISKL